MKQNILNYITYIVGILGVIIILILTSNIALKKLYLNVKELANSNNYNTKSYNSRRVYTLLKIVLDFISAMIGIVTLMPILMITYILCKVEFKSSPIVSQNQIGKNGEIYQAYKFRTMERRYNENINCKFNEYERSKLGLMLYKTGISELPMLFNILKGDISLVGRGRYPEVMLENKLIPEDILKEKPGLVNLWVISKDKQELDFDSCIKYDRYYINNKSIFLDMTIVLKCIIVAFGETGEY